MADIPYAIEAARLSDATGVAPINAGAKIAISGTGANTALLLSPASTGVAPAVIVFEATVPCLVRFGASGSTAVSTTKFDHYVGANSPRPLRVPSNCLCIDIVADPSASGSAYYSVVRWQF